MLEAGFPGLEPCQEGFRRGRVTGDKPVDNVDSAAVDNARTSANLPFSQAKTPSDRNFARRRRRSSSPEKPSSSSSASRTDSASSRAASSGSV